MTDSRGAGDLARTRVMASGAAVLTLAAGLGIRALAPGDAAKYAGDALYTILLLALIILARPAVTPWRAAGTALGISWAVEFAQLSGVPGELSRMSVTARLILGSTFNPPDLFWYAVGATSGWLLHISARRLTSRRPPPVPGPREGRLATGVDSAITRSQTP